MNKGRFFAGALILAALVVGFMIGRLDFRRASSYRYVPAVKSIILPKVVKKKAAASIAQAALPIISKKFKRPKVAVVMDDFGYNASDMDDFFAAGYPITLSILPNQKYSARIAEQAHSRGYEVILHLPLEASKDDVKEEPGTIRTSMSDSEITAILNDELASTPHIDGVSNHMGSKATEDRRVMSTVAGVLKKKKMYFFDSLTSRKSVAREASIDAGIRYGRRDIFLDIPNDPSYIEKQLLALRKMAFVKGSAIAVCQDRHNTIFVLKKMMPLLADDGIDFVFLSELVK